MSSKPSRQPRKEATIENTKIGFIGAGKLTEAIINGLCLYGKVDPRRIYVAAPSSTNINRLKENFAGLNTTNANRHIFGRFDCDIIFIAVNGNVIRNLYKMGGTRPSPLCTNYIPNMKHPFFVMSLVTGFEIKCIKEILLNPEHPHKYMIAIHRLMINCAIAFAKGVAAADVDPAGPKFPKVVFDLIKPLTLCFEYLSEAEMDAACALCGPGLAFSYYFINAISDGALKIGLGRAVAIKFAAKTSKCASETLLKLGTVHPNELKDEVCAPSSGAIYGCSILDKADVASGVSGAVEAAHKRAMSLAREDHHI